MAPNHVERQRSRAARNAFQRSNPCPSTGKRSGSCPGYVVDHRNALACGGADTPLNMQWQTVAQARLKDKTERAGCRYDLTKIEAQTALVLYYDGMEDRFFVFTSQGNPAPSLSHGDVTIVEFESVWSRRRFVLRSRSERLTALELDLFLGGRGSVFEAGPPLSGEGRGSASFNYRVTHTLPGEQDHAGGGSQWDGCRSVAVG